MKSETNRCPHCGQRLPLAAWLGAQSRNFWSTAELVTRYGTSAAHIGKEMKRLGMRCRKVRRRMHDGSLSKKLALYCVNPQLFADFDRRAPTQLRALHLREIASDVLAYLPKLRSTSEHV